MPTSRYILSVFIMLGSSTLLALGQAPRSPKKLSSEEILMREVAKCYTHFKSEDPDECVNIRNLTITDLLNDALSWQRIPFGIVLAPQDNGQTRIDFYPHGLFVRDLLDSITTADARYEWTIDDGVINLFPKSELSGLLDMRVADFAFEKSSVRQLFAALRAQPKVRQRAAELGLDAIERKTAPDENEFAITGFFDPSTFSVYCTNCVLRQVLNAIARESGRSWVYLEFSAGDKKTYRFGSSYDLHLTDTGPAAEKVDVSTQGAAVPVR